MAKRQFSILLGLACQTGCVVYDQTVRRETFDAAHDFSRDSALGARDATQDSLAQADMTAIDVEASREAGADVGAADGGSPTYDARDGDANAVADAHDATNDSLVDGLTPDGTVDVEMDRGGADGGDGGPDSASDALFDTPRDPPIVGCTVDFTVSGVVWDRDGVDGALREVRLVGDSGSLGGWEPTLGVPLIERAPGTWSASIPFSDRLTMEFKFVKLDAGRSPEWEQWPPFDSNRSFMVDCSTDGGTVWIDAASEAGPANRAVGRSYGGAFGLRPLDATK